MTLEATSTTNQDACLVALGEDRVGLVHTVTDFLVRCGVNIPSIRTASVGSDFALLAHFRGTNDQVGRVEAGISALQASSGLSILLHRSKGSAGPVESDEATHDVFVTAYDAVGIVSEVSALLERHNVNIERLGGDTYPAPNQGVPLFTVSASVQLPPDANESALATDLEQLRQSKGWADAEILPHGRVDTSSLAGSPPFPPQKAWQEHQ